MEHRNRGVDNDGAVVLQIDLKHHIAAICTSSSEGVHDVEIDIIKTTNNTPIEDHEPLILFRARDYLAVPLLEHYRRLCEMDGATDYQLASVDVLIAKFNQFAAENPDVMKQPGITRGK